jgi:hypothetical protein
MERHAEVTPPAKLVPEAAYSEKGAQEVGASGAGDLGYHTLLGPIAPAPKRAR